MEVYRQGNAMAKKEITVQFKLQAPGGTATPAPPIGPALGQHGVNPGQFIQQFNAASAHLKGKVIGVLVTVYKDRTFSFELKSPPASVLLKDLVKAEKGSGEPNKNKIGKVTMAQCKKIAEEKGKDLNAFDPDAAAKIIAGTARSMGITVEG
jgi:large subunit ribosomal protein L11